MPDETNQSELPETPVAESPGFFRDDSTSGTTSAVEVAPQAVSWTASEYVAHEKSLVWYVGLAAASIVVAAACYLLLKDVIACLVIVVAAAVFGTYAAKPPRQLEYEISGQSLRIAGKQYQFADFRSFALVPEGAFGAIVFLPMKRFAPALTVYYAPDDEKAILSILSGSLPLEEYYHDSVDRLMRRIRF